LTFEIGRRFAPKSLLGIDIDPELIRIAKKFAENLRDYQVFDSRYGQPKLFTLSAYLINFLNYLAKRHLKHKMT